MKTKNDRSDHFFEAIMISKNESFAVIYRIRKPVRSARIRHIPMGDGRVFSCQTSSGYVIGAGAFFCTDGESETCPVCLRFSRQQSLRSSPRRAHDTL